MRLHHLSATAFGPFAGTVTVDFEELNEAGLFLLTGPTGAGKSSLLDAVCFALYGQVPGARGVKTLKSHHAGPDARPEVVLDFSVRERRFVVRRSPEWSRPKKRGDGVTAEKAGASITEITGGREEFLSARAAEVGLLVGELMGMNADQFQQVALLPQGEFQTFLRASSQDRHTVLQHLFRTHRFSRIEEWVQEHSRELRERSGREQADVRRLLDAIAERSEVATPEDLAGDAVATVSEQRLGGWAAERRSAAVAAHEEAVRLHAQARRRLEELDARHEAALRRREHAERHAAARRTLAGLDESEQDAVAARHRVEEADRAGRVAPYLALSDRAAGVAAGADRDRERALRELAGLLTETPLHLAERLSGDVAAGVRPDADLLDPVLELDLELDLGLDTGAAASPAADDPDPLSSPEHLDRLAREARARATRLETLVPREEAARRAERDLADARRRLIEAEDVLARTEARLAELPAVVDAARAAVDDATLTAARREAVTLALASARARLAGATALAALATVVTEHADAHRDARDRLLDVREHLADLTARRLAGMAAELAGSLSDDTPCQVCGSTDHPAPARAAHDAVTPDEQDVAARAVTAAAELVERAATRLHETQQRRDAAAIAAEELTVPDATAEVERLEAELSATTTAAGEARTRARQRLDTALAEQAALVSTRTDTTAVIAAQREAAIGHERLVAAVVQELVEAGVSSRVLADDPGAAPGVTSAHDGDRPLASEVRALAALADAVDRARGVVETAARAAADATDLRVRAIEAAAEHGFARLEDARSAVLPDEDREALLRGLEERARVRARAEEALAEPLVPPAPPVSPDQPGRDGLSAPHAIDDASVEQLAELLTAARSQEAESSRRLHLADARKQAVEGLVERLDVAIRAWSPLRDGSQRAESMSRLVRGMGQDNQLQMRLSAYVLATRLDQVVDAANERLGHLRDQRYLLQRTGRAARRGSQAGLALEVVDQWTGDARDPSTLSGGETFVVSLSLALGLADVVTREAGGAEIDTLFVDEGFGTLDADTLDDVMDRLDGLRAGGRTVGVVSHVSELRNRIPTQVHVEKGRTGSTVALATLVG